MPRLLKKIEGTIFAHIETSTMFITSVEGFYGEEDYIKLGGFEAFLQDFRKTPLIEDLISPSNHGLKTKTPYVTLNISY